MPKSNFKKSAKVFIVLTLNLRFGLADDGANSWNFRKKAFPGLFKKYPADFMAFQEANDFQADFLDEVLKDYFYIGKREPAPSFWQNNLIFYKKEWKCIFKDHFFLSPTPDIPSRFRKSKWPRQCTIGIFEKSGFRLIIISTHFDFDPVVQKDSARIILKRLKKLNVEAPAILMGDFNTVPGSLCYKVLTGGDADKKEEKPGELPYFRDAFKPPFSGTHHGFKSSFSKDHIDWILYRGNITPIKADVIQDKPGGIYPSDHFPLRAIFKRS